MKKILLLMSCALVCTIAFATSSTLTIFSEDGHKFYLILNGQKMNEKPETNIRLQALTQAYYNCRIIFDDNTIEEVSKSYLPVTDAADPNVSQDVTYKIKAGKNGKQVLRFFSAQPVQVAATQAIAPEIAVYNYGTPTPAGPPVTTVTETTTTQVAGTNVGMNVNGMNVNVQMSEPVVTERTTTTTTYTTTSTQSAPPPAAPATPVSAGPCSYAMTPSDFQAAKESLSKATFEDTKLKSAKSIISGNCLYANQISEVCRLFTYEQSKLDFAKYAYKYCYDKNNYFKVNDVFDFDASRDELSAFTAR